MRELKLDCRPSVLCVIPRLGGVTKLELSA